VRQIRLQDGHRGVLFSFFFGQAKKNIIISSEESVNLFIRVWAVCIMVVLTGGHDSVYRKTDINGFGLPVRCIRDLL
jgi:hypothetical protein